MDVWYTCCVICVGFIFFCRSGGSRSSFGAQTIVLSSYFTHILMPFSKQQQQKKKHFSGYQIPRCTYTYCAIFRTLSIFVCALYCIHNNNTDVYLIHGALFHSISECIFSVGFSCDVVPPLIPLLKVHISRVTDTVAL